MVTLVSLLLGVACLGYLIMITAKALEAVHASFKANGLLFYTDSDMWYLVRMCILDWICTLLCGGISNLLMKGLAAGPLGMVLGIMVSYYLRRKSRSVSEPELAL